MHPDSSATPFADEYRPAEQFWHVELSFAPIVLLNLPLGHSTHSVLSELAYLPAPHAVQLAPAEVLTCPAPQSTQTRAPMSPDICVPAPQTAHTVLPFAPFVYFPGSQSPHDNARGEDENLSAGHVRHSNALEYFPLLHGTSAM